MNLLFPLLACVAVLLQGALDLRWRDARTILHKRAKIGVFGVAFISSALSVYFAYVAKEIAVKPSELDFIAADGTQVREFRVFNPDDDIRYGIWIAITPTDTEYSGPGHMVYEVEGQARDIDDGALQRQFVVKFLGHNAAGKLLHLIYLSVLDPGQSIYVRPAAYTTRAISDLPASAKKTVRVIAYTEKQPIRLRYSHEERVNFELPPGVSDIYIGSGTILAGGGEGAVMYDEQGNVLAMDSSAPLRPIPPAPPEGWCSYERDGEGYFGLAPCGSEPGDDPRITDRIFVGKVRFD